MTDWLTQLMRPLTNVIFTLGTDHVSWAELLGFLTGGMCVALTVRRSILNFPIGIANAALFLVLFASARLWADSALQVLYVVLGCAGWWQWLNGRTGMGPLQVRRASGRELATCVAVVVVGTAALYLLLRAAHDASPFLDALTTALSLVAQVLLNTRRIENWYFWIAADCIYLPLYVSRSLVLTALVYLLFLMLCFVGLREWTRERASPAEADVAR